MHNALFGIYEKALPTLSGWPEKLDAAAAAGYGFVEMSVDEDVDRLARLDWNAEERASLRSAIAGSGVRLHTVILSAQRRFPMGSAHLETRNYSLEILKKAIDLAVDIGARVIQLAGYYVFDEDRDARSRGRFMENLRRGLERASQAGVMLGIENMDGRDITSVDSAMELISELDSPWLRVYPDVGNLAANGLDVGQQLRVAAGHMVGVHLKDTRPGEYRRVPFGEGIVPFREVFQTLKDINYRGGYTVEMWNDGAPDALETIKKAREWLQAVAQATPEITEVAANEI